MPDRKIRIVIAEDHRLVRKGLKNLLEQHPRLCVVGEAADGKELMALLKDSGTDVVLLDIEMPNMNGRQALEIITKRFPDIKVVMLSVHSELMYMIEFVTMGARAYITKGASEETLWKTILAVHKDGHYFDQELSKAMLSSLQNKKSINPLFDELALSKRELEILKELCQGKTNKEIAASLKITMTTVNFHRVNIYRKTKSHNIAELIQYSMKQGLIQ